MTDPERIYEYPASANEPNCFTEVIERGGQLLSLPHPDFEADMFLCRRGGLGHGRKSRLWDKLQDDIFELRLHVSSDRIFRLFFIQSGGLVFLNGFVKKTQKTPAGEIAKAREIIKQIRR